MTHEPIATLQGIIDRMGLRATVQGREEGERLVLDVQGEDAEIAVGKQGATLDALQHLVNKITVRETGPLVTVDACGYRSRRGDSLTEMARELGTKVAASGRPVVMHDLSAADRRVIHMALAEHAEVETRSEGEGRDRHLVIAPKKGAR